MVSLTEWIFSWKYYSYSLIDDQTQNGKSSAIPTKRRKFYTVLSYLTLFLLGVLLGKFVDFGNWRTKINAQTTLKISSEQSVFRYNRTFGERPSNKTNQAWNGLFPHQGGYFRHPQIAPQRSALAVFHQLHCLDGIRKGYWTVYDAATEGRKIVEEDIPFMASPSHIRHCIDLLRNSLMCQPDLTVEVKDMKKGGVTGFGTEHTCKSWNQLNEWITKWETYGQSEKAQLNEK
ncbi:hypothetical protein BGZ60DRAFT_259733 [Tricladium varicosporioides]|nr:hypothetical protein BGZ60DRAFT_259733 [Hymenoscyphus varicosporioides]